jgi:diacylglycerol kinase family enzyme
MSSAPPEALERLAQAAALSPSAPSKRMLIIVNPYATTVSDRLRNLVVYALQGRYEVEAADTQNAGHATELCREAAHEGYDVVVAFGGDGTVNEAANGLIGSDTPLTCLPGGATNVYAKLLGIPGEIVDATEHLLRMADDWRPRMVDVGVVNDRLFTFSAGVGLDASVVDRVERRPRLKAQLRGWYFASVAVGTFTRRYLVRPPRLELAVDGRAIPGVTAVVQNAENYTYFDNRPIRAGEGATLDSGTFSGIVLDRANPLDVPTIGWRLLSKHARFVDHRHVHGFSGASELTVSSADDRLLPLQVDGDFVGDVAEARFAVRPRGLAVVA